MDWWGPDTNKWKRYDPQNPLNDQYNPYRYNPGSSTCSLSGQLLATSKQIYVESSDVLYGDNTFGLHIYVCRESKKSPYGSRVEASFHEGVAIDELAEPWPKRACYPRGKDRPHDSDVFDYQFAVDKLRRLRLVIDLDNGDNRTTSNEFDSLRHTLYKVCQRLASIQLQYLNIDLQSRYPLTRFCVLEPLLVLRNLRVTFEREPQNPLLMRRRNYFEVRQGKRVPRQKLDLSLPGRQPRYADFLKQLLESSTPPCSKVLKTYYYRSISSFLLLHDTPPSTYNQLEILSEVDGNFDCTDGPFEACEHLAGSQINQQHQQLTLSDDDDDDEDDEIAYRRFVERRSLWADRVQEDEEGEGLDKDGEGDELNKDRDGDGLKENEEEDAAR